MPTNTVTAVLRARLKELNDERRQIERFLGSLIKKPAGVVKKRFRSATKSVKARKRPTWTPEMRAEAAKRMKARWAKRKAKG